MIKHFKRKVDAVVLQLLCCNINMGVQRAKNLARKVVKKKILTVEESAVVCRALRGKTTTPNQHASARGLTGAQEMSGTVDSGARVTWFRVEGISSGATTAQGGVRLNASLKSR